MWPSINMGTRRRRRDCFKKVREARICFTRIVMYEEFIRNINRMNCLFWCHTATNKHNVNTATSIFQEKLSDDSIIASILVAITAAHHAYVTGQWVSKLPSQLILWTDRNWCHRRITFIFYNHQLGNKPSRACPHDTRSTASPHTHANTTLQPIS